MFAHVHVDAEPPSSHAPGIPPELDAIILKCLAKKREDRYADADALADALRAVPLARPWTRQRALEWWRTQGAVVQPKVTTAAAVADTHASPIT